MIPRDYFDHRSLHIQATEAWLCWFTNQPKCEHTLEQSYSGMYSIFQHSLMLRGQKTNYSEWSSYHNCTTYRCMRNLVRFLEFAESLIKIFKKCKIRIRFAESTSLFSQCFICSIFNAWYVVYSVLYMCFIQCFICVRGRPRASHRDVI